MNHWLEVSSSSKDSTQALEQVFHSMLKHGKVPPKFATALAIRDALVNHIKEHPAFTHCENLDNFCLYVSLGNVPPESIHTAAPKNYIHIGLSLTPNQTISAVQVYTGHLLSRNQTTINPDATLELGQMSVAKGGLLYREPAHNSTEWSRVVLGATAVETIKFAMPM
ncbi:MAG: hypothetical protein SGILL_006444 [Bacillariaceae sp.]